MVHKKSMRQFAMHGVLFLAALLLLVLTSPLPAQAHFTDPQHSLWTVQLHVNAPVIGPGEAAPFTVVSRFNIDPSQLPSGFAFFNRTYSFVLPQGFQITDASIGSGTCTIQVNTAQCQAGFALGPGEGDMVSFGATTPLQEGDYQATVTTSATIGGTTYTDTDSQTQAVVARRPVDLAWIQTPGPSTVLEAGELQTLTYGLTNRGPSPARQVTTIIDADAGSGPFGPLKAVAASKPSCFPILPTTADRAECTFETVAVGETVTVTLTVLMIPFPQQEDTTGQFQAEARAYDQETNPADNNVAEDILFHCSSYIAPSASVDPTAQITDAGCTYVGVGAVIGAHAKLGKGAWVTDRSVVGDHAELDALAVLWGRSLQSIIEPYGVIGKSSQVVGEVGTHAKIGTDVQAGVAEAYWVIVEPRATVGSRSRISLPRPWEQSVRIFEGAAVPSGTVIDETYCQQRPTICTIY
jgi:hypothetical protein